MSSSLAEEPLTSCMALNPISNSDSPHTVQPCYGPKLLTPADQALKPTPGLLGTFAGPFTWS